MSSFARTLGQWMDAKVLARLPKLRRDFEMSRDGVAPSKPTQRDDTTANGRKAPEKPPEPALKPPLHMRGSADRDGWLAAEVDALLAKVQAYEAQREDTPTPSRGMEGPSR